MIFLFLSIIFSTIINLVFRWYKQWNINTSEAITWNYLICAVCGIALNEDPDIKGIYQYYNWSLFAIILGFLFIGVFFLMARTAQEFGVSVSAISAKMAVIFPVLFGLIALKEQLNILITAGILLSLVSVWLVSASSGKAERGRFWYYPFLVFTGSGIIDASLKYLSWKHPDFSEATLSVQIFSTAAVVGFVILGFNSIGNGKLPVLKNLFAGVLLGVPNYFSIYFLLKAINIPRFPASVLFPVNNIGVVLLSALLSLIIFKESFDKRKMAGLFLAIIAIVILSCQMQLHDV